MMPFSECHEILRPLNTPVYLVGALAASVFFAGAAEAQMRLDPDCTRAEGSPANCTHVVACIGGDTLFVGGSTGWDSGTLAGELFTGETCTGTWDNATGLAKIDCGGRLEGMVEYTVFDGATGTAIGQGEMLDGRPITAWTGNNLAEFVQAETGSVTLQCGVQEIPLS